MIGTALKAAGVAMVVVLIVVGYLTYGWANQSSGLSDQGPERPALTGDEVVVHDWSAYTNKHTIENSYFVVNQGEKVDGGCRFVVQGLRGSEGRGTVVRQVAVNPDTCQELLEVSDSPYSAEDALHRDRPKEGGSSSSAKPKQREPGSSSAE